MPALAKLPQAAAHAALRAGYLRSPPEVLPDDKGYVADAVLNLIGGVQLSDFEADVRQGDGNEMAGKFGLSTHRPL